MASQAEVDKFLRDGRIGPALLHSYNLHHKTSFTLASCTFSARRSSQPGHHAEIVLFINDREATQIRVVQLPIIIPGGINLEESRFFHSLDIGWINWS